MESNFSHLSIGNEADLSNLSKELVQEIKDTFQQFDVEGEGRVEGTDTIIAMFLLLGCDVSKDRFGDIYQDVFGSRPEEEPSVTLQEFAKMMDHFVSDVDPVDGVIESIREQFDVQDTGKCTYIDLIKFMEENDYLNADPESC